LEVVNASPNACHPIQDTSSPLRPCQLVANFVFGTDQKQILPRVSARAMEEQFDGAGGVV
jgi:hypothetical protein